MMTNEEINKKVAEIRKREEKAAKLKAELDALRDELKAELDSRKADSVDTGIHRVFYQVYEKAAINTKALKEAGLYDSYSTKQVVCQFRITDVSLL